MVSDLPLRLTLFFQQVSFWKRRNKQTNKVCCKLAHVWQQLGASGIGNPTPYRKHAGPVLRRTSPPTKKSLLWDVSLSLEGHVSRT